MVGENDFHALTLYKQGPFKKEKFFTVIVKRTYSITEKGELEALPRDDQPGILAAAPYEDDLGRSIEYPGDFDEYKPLVDVIVNGTAFAPDGQPVDQLDVSLEVKELKKTLRVFGNRRWVRGELDEIHISDPEPFLSMPIRWEKAFGSLDNRANPMGMGKYQDHETDPEDPIFSLPNIENPDELLEEFGSEVKPVGFSTVSQTWEPRTSLFGTMNAYWATFRSPLPPKDLNPRYYNAAPEDQQFEDMRGDEALNFVNLNEKFPRYQIQLPAIKPRFFYVPMNKNAEEQALDLIEENIKFDTVVVDLTESLIHLVWRGRIDCIDTGALDTTLYLYVVEDKIEETIPFEEIQKKFEEEVVDIEKTREAGVISEEKVMASVWGPLVEQIVKVLEEVKADPSLIAAAAAMTDPESGKEMFQAEFTKLQSQLTKQADEEHAKAKKLRESQQ